TARRGVSKSLLFTWRRQVREGLLGPAPQSAVFVPVQTLAPTGTTMAPSMTGYARHRCRGLRVRLA
ncbi:MAG: hypothetical protein ACRYHQ_19155, partial [Janthinobacterium lividum]